MRRHDELLAATPPDSLFLYGTDPQSLLTDATWSLKAINGLLVAEAPGGGGYLGGLHREHLHALLCLVGYRLEQALTSYERELRLRGQVSAAANRN